ELKKACSEFGCGQSSIRADLVYSLWAKAEDNLDLANDIVTFLAERQEINDAVSSSQTDKREATALERDRVKLELERVALEKMKEQNALQKPPETLAHEIRLAEIEREKTLETLRVTKEAEIGCKE